MKYDMSIHLHKTPLNFIISVVSLSPSFLVFNKHGGKGGGGVTWVYSFLIISSSNTTEIVYVASFSGIHYFIGIHHVYEQFM